MRLKGEPAAPGYASGPICRAPSPATAAEEAPPSGDPKAEAERLRVALAAAGEELATLQASLDDTEAQVIVEFQSAMLEDDEFLAPAFTAIAEGHGARSAWRALAAETIADYTAADDEYFQARSADIRDLRERVTAALDGDGLATIPPGSVLLAEDITPTQFLQTQWGKGGLALFRGSASSHVAMLARARGVPMVVRVGDADAGTAGTALLDGVDGLLIVNPDAATARRFDQRARARAQQDEAARHYLGAPAATAGGEAVHVYLNVAATDDLKGIDPAHCDGVGLVRTEFLYAGAAPDEQAQYAFYRQIVEWAQGRPVTLRTLDAGGDKPIPGITPVGEANPFLGVRGLRLSLRHPEVFRSQLRAMLRAAALGPVRIMLPMVTQPDEVRAARAMTEEIKTALRAEGIACGDPLLGIMVEVPAAAIAIDEFEIDFCSIGSNDLVQYVTACARDAGDLAELAKPDATAVLRLIRTVVTHGRANGIEVSLCGDAAADQRYLGRLLDTGLRAVSVAPAALARTKAAVAAYGAKTHGR